MLNRRILTMIFVILILGNFLAGCISFSQNNINEKPEFIEITDDMGDTVKVPTEINKIISLAASITEILFSLKLGHMIVGRDSGSNYPSEAKNIEVVSTFEGIDLEKILVAEPDIIFLDKTLDMSDTNYDKLIENGLTVFRLYPQELTDVVDNIKLLGEVAGQESLGNEIASQLQGRINSVKTRGEAIPVPNQPTILYVIYYDGTSSPWVGTTSTISGDLIETAGGSVAVEDSTGFSIQITIEQLIGLDPDIILTSQDETWPTPSRESILNDDALSEVSAVKSNKVFDINADMVDRPGPRIVDGLELISGYINP